MKILGIESSCDETAAAVIEDGSRLLSNVVHSQIDIHAEYGGVVPEIAARSHIEVINPVINRALAEANCSWSDIDAIAVTYAPGLVGSLLVGTLAARTLAIIHSKPLYAIHHVEGHVYANFITEQATPNDEAYHQERLRAAPQSGLASSDARAADVPDGRPHRSAEKSNQSEDTPDRLNLPKNQPSFPLLALIVSGGHSQLVLFKNHGNYQLLGQTQDDAVGEAFDKVAKILGLPYPGGPSISKAAQAGDPYKYQLPKAKLKDQYNFSFSGLKTAVLRAVQHEMGKDYTFPSHALAELLTPSQQNDFAASFQRVAVETLVDKTELAFKNYAPQSVVIAGGVAANQELRRQLSERLPIAIEYAPGALCTDNAAMIASLAYFYSQTQEPSDPYNLEVIPSVSMSKTAWSLT